MKNECSIIRDILPLYADKMVSADTASFVEEHLTGCAECRAELEKLKVADVIESAVSDTENDDEKRLKAFAGKINRKRHIVISAFAAVLLIIFLLGGYELFTEYMKNRGFSEVEQFGSQHIFSDGERTERVIYYQNTYFSKWLWD